MLNPKLKHVVFFLGLIMAPQAMPAASSSPAASLGEVDAMRDGYFLGLRLEVPRVRQCVSDYTSRRAGQPCKLAIGAGHITNPMDLHPVYQPGGSNCLTESIQGSRDYTFHEHKDWYTFSAETDDPFGSDMMGNIRVTSHQNALLPFNTWDLVWDESYHPDVLSAPGLPSSIFKALKKGGKYVFTLPLELLKSQTKFCGRPVLVTGHDCIEKTKTGEFNEALAYKNLSRSTYYTSCDSVVSSLRAKLTELGFSSVELHKSISLTAFEEVVGQTVFEIQASSLIKPYRETDREVDLKIKSIITRGAHPLLSIDTIFAHTGGMYYVVATK